MKITLAYGTKGLSVELPDRNIAGVLRMAPLREVPDPLQCLEDALDGPIGADRLESIATGMKSACIVVTDPTRPTPTPLLLPPLLRRLRKAGISPGRTVILVATGLHEPCGDEELRRLVGQETVEHYAVRNHDAVDPGETVFLGVTRAGTGVYINRHYLEADCKVLTGLIEPHFMAGFSGGRKCLCPGIAGHRTIAATHAPLFIADAGSAPGVIDGNPFHHEITAAARMAPPHFILNAALNDEREITGIFAGDMEKAFMEGARFVARSHTASLPREADVVVTSGAGEPLDQTLYQAVKGMVGALEVVRTGGTIIIASRCASGVGSRDFAEALGSFKGVDAFMREASSPGYFKKDAWQVVELCKAMEKARIMMFTEGIDDDVLLRCGIVPAAGVEGAVRQCLREYGKNASVAVIPQGPYLIAARS